MPTAISEAIRAYAQEKDLDDETIFSVVEQALRAAYKKRFNTDNNIEFSRENGDIVMFSRKQIVSEVEDPVQELSLEEARKLSPSCEEGDELLVEVDTTTEFTRVAAQAGIQRAQQCLQDIQKENIVSEYSSQVGEIIIGYYQRERNNNIYVDLGKNKVEGFLPKKFQSPREEYGPASRIKALIREVKKHRQSNIVQLVLSRTDPDFVAKLLEIEVPEVYDGIVEIYRIVRDAGYRTKIAVVSHREDVDPVGACVGTKGSRIQIVIKELEGEKIDILNFSDNPREFIANSLSPAEVIDVVILDVEKKTALAIVAESQLSLAIGKQGLNVRLANRLSGWNIDVKTSEEFEQMDIYTNVRQAAEDLFSDVDQETEETLESIPQLTPEICEILHTNNINIPQELYDLSDEEINTLTGLSEDSAKIIIAFLNGEEPDSTSDDDSNNADNSSVDSSGNDESDEENERAEDDEYEDIFSCPECGGDITINMTVCPHCDVGLVFEEYEDEE